MGASSNIDVLRQKAEERSFEMLSCFWKELSGVRPETVKELSMGDKWFARHLASELLAYVLRPYSVSDREVLEELVVASSFGESRSVSVDSLLEIVRKRGALYRGHFKLLSGLHSEYFMVFKRIAETECDLELISQEIISRFHQHSVPVDTVVGFVTAGGYLAKKVAEMLSAKLAFLDVDEKSRPTEVYHGDEIVGESLLLDDLMTTGEGIERAIGIVAEAGGHVAGLGLFATRGHESLKGVEKIKRKYKIPVEVLLHIAVEAEDPSDCTQCKSDQEIYDSRKLN